MAYHVYILVSRSGNALYTGMTDDLAKRILQHQTGKADAHTQFYRIRHLVYVECHETREAAQLRERQIKRWRRAWKVALIESQNPSWRDLSMEYLA